MFYKIEAAGNRKKSKMQGAELSMCMITLYRGSVKEENKIMGEIEKYSLDLAKGELTVYPMLKEALVVKITGSLSWDESNDSMIVD